MTIAVRKQLRMPLLEWTTVALDEASNVLDISPSPIDQFGVSIW